MVVVGSEESIKNLETYADIWRSSPIRAGSPTRRRATIIAKAKPIYHFMGGLHSAETGPPEMLMELAYRLATEDSPLIKKIRDNVIVTITPAAEPDGRDRYVDWYNKYKINDTERARSGAGPALLGQVHLPRQQSRHQLLADDHANLLKWYLQWHPPIMHDLHESEPFMYTFSGQAPQNPTLDPILYGEMPWFSNFEMEQMINYGMPGVWTHAFVDMWSPGYLGFMSSNHNGMMRMYETFGNGGANTMHRRIDGGRGRRRRREGGRGGRRRHDHARMVPAAAAVSRSRVVHAQQHQLYGDRRADRAAVDLGVSRNHSREFLQEEPQLDRVRQERRAVRLRDSRRASRHDARGVHREYSAPAGHRSGPRDRGSEAERRHFSRRLVRDQARPAVWTPGEDSAREAEFPGPEPDHL